MTCLQTMSLGAYVLGALEAAERLEIEEHLRDCAQCRDELVRLAPLPGLLGQVSLDELGLPEGDQLPEPAPGRPPVRDSQSWWRRTRVLVTAAAVAAVLGAVGVAGHVVTDDPASQETAAATWSTAGTDGIDATAVLTDRGWGTDVELTMENLPARLRCRLVVRSQDGRVETVGWWTTGYATSATVPAGTSIPLDAIDRLEVRAGDRVLAVMTPTA